MSESTITKIFISHSSKDIKYVEPLVNLLDKIGLTEKEIFCSSMPGYGIPVGENIYDYLAKEFQSNNLMVIFILSKNYYKSPACLNEMGASWVLKKKYYTILLPEFEFKRIDGAIDPRNYAIKLGPSSYKLKNELAQLRDIVKTTFGLNGISEVRWETYRDKFIDEISNT